MNLKLQLQQTLSIIYQAHTPTESYAVETEYPDTVK